MKEAARTLLRLLAGRFHIATHGLIPGSICQINQENRFSA
jgi:hypothetical protein